MQTVLEATQTPKAEQKRLQTTMELAEAILKAQTPESRLAFMQGYVLRHPDEAEAYRPYMQLLEGLVKEVNGDYSNPVTSYGCLIGFRQLSEEDFIDKIKDINLKYTESERRKAHQQMRAVTVPELTEEEVIKNYTTGSILSPTMNQLWDDLEEPAGQLICDYLDKSEWYTLFDSADWLAESVIEPLLSLHPDIQNAILKALHETH